MKTIEELKCTPRLLIAEIAEDGIRGLVHFPRWKGTVIASWGGGWEHVSVCPFKHHIIPSWEDMCRLKEMFFREDEWVVQFHPAKDQYVNNMPNCLHLWKPVNENLPTPPSWMTGLRKGQSMQDVLKEIEEDEHGKIH